MSEKVTATIVAQNGVKRELEGNTVIVFTIRKEKLDGNKTNLEARAGIIGEHIPNELFYSLFGDFVINTIESHFENKPLEAAFNMREISTSLKARSDEIISKTSKEEIESELDKVFEEILKRRR